jgi:plastocyanin
MNMPPKEPSPGQSVASEPSPIDSQPPIVPTTTPSTGNKLLVVVGLVLLLVAVGIGAYYAFHPSKKTASITSINKIAPAQVGITSTGFVPATINIKVDQAVAWTNKDKSPHWVASDPYPTDNALAGFNAKHNMTFNDSFSFIFNKAGTYTYHDNLNPYTIKGTVIVKQ